MTAPRLNRSLILEGPVKLADGAGGFDLSWEPLGVIWAEMQPRSGRDAKGDEARLTRVPYRITVRAVPYGAPSRPNAGQRFRDGNRIFAITAVAEQGVDARYLTCHAEEERAI